jgi:hypothetical protein
MDTTVCFNPKHMALGGEGDRFFEILDILQEQHLVRKAILTR